MAAGEDTSWEKPILSFLLGGIFGIFLGSIRVFGVFVFKVFGGLGFFF